MKPLSDRLLNDHIIEKIWKRDPSAWHAAPGSAEEKSIATRVPSVNGRAGGATRP